MSSETIIAIIIGAVCTILAAIIGIVVNIKIMRVKKPVYAINTQKILGIGSDAPPELRLIFGDKQINELYKTTLIFFNQGTESIRDSDITNKIQFSFKESEILRQPIIKALSKKEIQFEAEILTTDISSIQLCFRYLDHNDGAELEILHTNSNSVIYTGNIIGSKPVKKLEYKAHRSKQKITREYLSDCILLVSSIFLLYGGITDDSGQANYSLIGFAVGLFILFLIAIIRDWKSNKRFPKWESNIHAGNI